MFADATLTPMSVAKLEAELAAITERELELKKQISQASRQQARSNERMGGDLASLLQDLGASSEADGTARQLPPRLARHKDRVALLALFRLACDCADAVACWVLGHGVGRSRLCSNFVHIDPELRRRTASGVEWLYILSSEEDINNSVESVHEDVYYLSRYVVEYNLFLWAVKQNCERGVASQNRQLFAAAVRNVPIGIPDEVVDKLNNFFLTDTRRLRMWSVEFRKRWGIERGRLCAGENFDPEILQNRVPWPSSDFAVELYKPAQVLLIFHKPCPAPNTLDSWKARSQKHVLWFQKWERNSVPISGPSPTKNRRRFPFLERKNVPISGT